ncbi:hypothetical protein [Caminibacter sp.]
MAKIEEARKIFKEIGSVYNITPDEVEEIFYEIMCKHLNEDNILLDDDGLYVNGILYEYFDISEIRKFRTALEDEIQRYSIKKWENYLNMYLRNKKIITGTLQKEGKKFYYFSPIDDDNKKLQNILLIQVPKTNVRLNFSVEKGNVFSLYLSDKPKIFRKEKPIYFNKFFTVAKIITRSSVKAIINEKIISVFKSIYTADDFKIKYISPIKSRYGIINLIIKKPISANLLNYLNKSFEKYGYIVNAKERKNNV